MKTMCPSPGTVHFFIVPAGRTKWNNSIILAEDVLFKSIFPLLISIGSKKENYTRNITSQLQTEKHCKHVHWKTVNLNVLYTEE